MKRKEIEVKEEICFEPVGNIDEIINKLLSIKEKIKNKDGEKIELNYELEGHDAYGPYFYVKFVRPETDQELSKRKKLMKNKREENAKLKKEKEEIELAEYKRLKAKFG